MPAGVPVLTTAIGVAGAKNAALAAIRILSLNDDNLSKQLIEYQMNIASEVRDTKLP